MTTIKFVEEDSLGHDMPPQYFTFSGHLIQFQSLVVRFEDKFVAAGDRFKGRSVYLFWKVFMLDGAHTQEFPITQVDEIPGGYKIPGHTSGFENRFWKDFWRFAFDEDIGPGMLASKAFRRGTRRYFHSGGICILSILSTTEGLGLMLNPVEPIFRGEKILSVISE